MPLPLARRLLPLRLPCTRLGGGKMTVPQRFIWGASVAAIGSVLFPMAEPAFAQNVIHPDVSFEQNAERDEPSLPWLGLVFDVGVPDGMNLGLVVRPLSVLRVHAGGAFNLANFGLRAGVAYVPFNFWIVPTVVVEGGHFFEASPRDIVSSLASVDVDYVPESLSYTYANAHLGLELGGDRFTFFLRGGYSYLAASLRPPSDDEIRFEDNVSVTGWLPSAKLGLIVYLN
ncbi:MAG: hypothetical protein AAFV29_13200 [Myxococcota bacterium]